MIKIFKLDWDYIQFEADLGLFSLSYHGNKIALWQIHSNKPNELLFEKEFKKKRK